MRGENGRKSSKPVAPSVQLGLLLGGGARGEGGIPGKSRQLWGACGASGWYWKREFAAGGAGEAEGGNSRC